MTCIYVKPIFTICRWTTVVAGTTFVTLVRLAGSNFITSAVVRGQSVKSFMIIYQWHISHSPTIYPKRCDVEQCKAIRNGGLFARLGLMYKYKIKNYNKFHIDKCFII